MVDNWIPLGISFSPLLLSLCQVYTHPQCFPSEVLYSPSGLDMNILPLHCPVFLRLLFHLLR